MAPKKLYLPSWILWVLLPLLALVWGLITFSTFTARPGQELLGTLEWGLASLLILALAVIFWLMGTRRLPAYIMEEDDADPV